MRKSKQQFISLWNSCKLKFSRVAQLTIFTFLLSLFGNNVVNAYLSYPEKWPTNSVTYDQSALNAGWASAVWEGARQWNNVSPSPFTFSAVNLNTNNNDVWLANIDGQYGTYAQTITYFPGGTTINRFTMQFDSSENWTGGLGVPSSTQLDSVSVAAHEMGHAFGLGHSQWWNCSFLTNENDLPTMCGGYFYGKVYFRYLEQDDIDAINTKYP